MTPASHASNSSRKRRTNITACACCSQRTIRINALLARTLLSRVGCTVDVVQDGEEAVAAAAAAPYDLIFLDLRMPRLDGIAAAQRIRALDGPAARTPLVALTADAGEEDRAACSAPAWTILSPSQFNPSGWWMCWRALPRRQSPPVFSLNFAARVLLSKARGCS